MKTRLNIERLVGDLGGAAEVAKAINTSRTVPYGWIQRRFLGSRAMEALKTAFPQLNIDHYFEDTNGDRSHRRSSPRRHAA